MSVQPKSTSMPKVSVPSGMDYNPTTTSVKSAGTPNKSVRMSAQKPKYVGTK